MAKTAQQNPKKEATVKQLLALATFVAGVLADIFSADSIQYWLQNKSELRKKLLEMFNIPIDIYTETRNDWQKFYQSIGITVDLSTVSIPEKPSTGNWRLLFIAAGLTCNKIYELWNFPKWKNYDDIDTGMKHSRTTETTYAIWVQDSPEPDTETLGKSTRQADTESINDLSKSIGVTLIERMIHESKYFTETGNHLDVNGLTFCSGSRDAGGSVPSVDRSGRGWVCVDWYFVGYCFSVYGIRVAVSKT